MSKTKSCRKCGATKVPLMDYNGRGTMWCRPCNAERFRRYRATERGAEMTRRAVYRAWGREPEKQAARTILNAAVRAGRVVRPKSCPKCDKRCTVDAHHTDYSKPLKVKWLCRQCHADLHKRKKS